jgi:hypothetical protein
MTVMPRFVVLFHEVPPNLPRASHCDLMLEMGDVLWTWELPQWPPAQGVQAVRLPDHRRDYLEYEGPLSEGRGSVRRLDQGTYRIVAHTRGRLLLQVRGQHHRGRLHLEQMPASGLPSGETQRVWGVAWAEETSAEPSTDADG